MRKFWYIIFLLVIGLILLAACGAEPQQDNSKLAVVATTSIIGDVVANIGGDMIELTVIVGIGQNPHSFEPTPKDLAAIETADVVFINGLDLEEMLVEAIDDIATGVVASVSIGIDPLPFGDDQYADHRDDEQEEEDNHTAGDPHFWVDPNNVIVWVENIARVLSEADPVNAVGFNENAAAYSVELNALDAYIRQQTAQIPEEERKIVTDHHSLGYFAEEYGYQIIGAVIPSTSDTGGASAGEVAELAGLMKAEDVRAIFIGETAGQGMQNLAEALAEEVGGAVQIITLLTGSLAEAGEPGDTYLGYLRYNTDQIVAGLAN
ncbi:MAG: zinc ABC transporter substrate-binding protein [Anaerolineales bacterium]|nr:zinc ABC transporter substrate-binding protein [Anaerolineales bacterium]